jgi:hypothetical protein
MTFWFYEDDMADKQQVIDAFVEALVIRLEADRERATTPDMRSALAKARAATTEMLSTTEYDEAVFRAFRLAGWE